MLQAGLIIKLFFADFCHAQNLGKGSYGFIFGQDANRHTIVVAGMHTIMPESTESWKDLLEPSREFYGAELLDTAEVIHISDADKGAARCYLELLLHAFPFICSQHRGETMGGKFGKGAKMMYLNFAKATSQQEQDKALNVMPRRMRSEVLNMPRSAQCLLSHPGKMHGVSTSNVVESGNKAAKEIRCCPDPFYALVRFVEYSQEKFEEHKAAAFAARTTATPRVIQDLAIAEAQSNGFSRSVWVNERLKSGRVYTGDGAVNFHATINGGDHPVSCSCGVPEVNRKVCAHAIYIAKAAGLQLQSLVFPEDTVVRWKQQYAAAGVIPVPLLSSLIIPDTPRLKQPLAVPRLRGAPRKKRGKGRSDAVAEYAKKMRAEHVLEQRRADKRAQAAAPAPPGARAPIVLRKTAARTATHAQQGFANLPGDRA